MNKQAQIRYATKRLYPKIIHNTLFFDIVDKIHNRIIYHIGTGIHNALLNTDKKNENIK